MTAVGSILFFLGLLVSAIGSDRDFKRIFYYWKNFLFLNLKKINPKHSQATRSIFRSPKTDFLLYFENFFYLFSKLVQNDTTHPVVIAPFRGCQPPVFMEFNETNWFWKQGLNTHSFNLTPISLGVITNTKKVHQKCLQKELDKVKS